MALAAPAHGATQGWTGSVAIEFSSTEHVEDALVTRDGFTEISGNGEFDEVIHGSLTRGRVTSSYSSESGQAWNLPPLQQCALHVLLHQETSGNGNAVDDLRVERQGDQWWVWPVQGAVSVPTTTTSTFACAPEDSSSGSALSWGTSGPVVIDAPADATHLTGTFDLTGNGVAGLSVGTFEGPGFHSHSRATLTIDLRRTLGTIIVEKQTDPDGASGSFPFSGDLEGSIADGETLSRSVVPGSYTVTEGAVPGWELTQIRCNDTDSSGAGATATFRVEAGETVRCVFTNEERLRYTAGYDYDVLFSKKLPAVISGFGYVRVTGSARQLARVSQICIVDSWSAGLQRPSASTVPVYWGYDPTALEGPPEGYTFTGISSLFEAIVRKEPLCSGGHDLVFNLGRNGRAAFYALGTRDGLHSIPVVSIGHAVRYLVYVDGSPITISVPSDSVTAGKGKSKKLGGDLDESVSGEL